MKSTVQLEADVRLLRKQLADLLAAHTALQASYDLLATALTLLSGSIGINEASPDGKLDVAQSSLTAAIPVLELQQADLSEEFVNFVTTVGVGNPIEAVGAKTLTTTHFVRIQIEGVGYRFVPVGTIA